MTDQYEQLLEAVFTGRRHGPLPDALIDREAAKVEMERSAVA